MTKTILLTGGAGYIGSHTYVALVASGYDVVILDNFDNAKRDVPDRLELITGKPVTVEDADVLDPAALAAVFDRHRIDGVVHFAAKKAVGESWKIPLDYFQTNLGGLLNILKAMEVHQARKLVFSSSATVYGQPDQLPVTEDAPLTYASPYAYTKLAGEQMLQQIEQSDSAWAFGILRYFNPVGAHGSALIGEDPSDIPNNLMPYIAKVATGDLDQLGVFGDDYDTPDGTGVRDYIHVEDLAMGHVLSLNRLFETDHGHLVNLGTGVGYSVMDMLRAYSRACGRDLPYAIKPRRAGDVSIYYGDPTKARAELGFQAEKDLDDMCSSSWNWVSRQRNG